jgi:uroporphyrinogen decarboxylase
MHEGQWNTLVEVVQGRDIRPTPVGFIIDSPWLPGWTGCSILDYFTSETVWLEANLKAIRTFPDAIFLPGFWSEYGMCTEPSAFGAKTVWIENDLPHAGPILDSIEDVDRLRKPNVRTDGLLPFVLARLKRQESAIREAGHTIRFAVARGPLNIASFLMGTSEFLLALLTDPDRAHKLMTILTDFLRDWIALQIQTFPTIDGLLLLDDIIGFVGGTQSEEFVTPYLKRLYGEFDVTVRFLHNDAEGLVCAPSLAGIGINLFNFSHNHSLAEMRAACGPSVALLGNIPPRDVLAAGSPDDVRRAVRHALEGIEDRSGILLSCGGGMPPGVSTQNIRAFIETAREA